jgi:hypothetical protein
MSNKYDTLRITDYTGGKPNEIIFTRKLTGYFSNGPLTKDSIYTSNISKVMTLEELINTYGDELKSYDGYIFVHVDMNHLKASAGIPLGGKRKTKMRRKNRRSTRKSRRSRRRR